MKVPEECKKGTELKNGVGTTVYHFVESIESVCSLFLSIISNGRKRLLSPE